MRRARIRRVLLEPEALSEGMTARVLEGLGPVPLSLSTEGDGPEEGIPGSPGKDTLHLLVYHGDFLKPCPGTREYICCGYQILNLAANCPLDCSYCILQAYMNRPFLRVFTNVEEGLERALSLIDAEPGRIFRVGTGEFTDSLALDPLTRWTQTLLPAFSTRKNAVLELKTKTTRIRGLLGAPVRERIIVSWSLNSEAIAGREEKGAPGIEARIRAAARCQREGYVTGFHFDPMIEHPGWEEGYARTVALMKRHLDPRKIIWISLGSLRFMPGLKALLRRRHPESRILDSEFILGMDGKMRYFKPIRMDLYRTLARLLRGWYEDLGLYLCMESDEIWQDGLGWSPGDSAGLSGYLDGRVRLFFG